MVWSPLGGGAGSRCWIAVRGVGAHREMVVRTGEALFGREGEQCWIAVRGVGAHLGMVVRTGEARAKARMRRRSMSEGRLKGRFPQAVFMHSDGVYGMRQYRGWRMNKAVKVTSKCIDGLYLLDPPTTVGPEESQASGCDRVHGEGEGRGGGISPSFLFGAADGQGLAGKDEGCVDPVGSLEGANRRGISSIGRRCRPPPHPPPRTSMPSRLLLPRPLNPWPSSPPVAGLG